MNRAERRRQQRWAQDVMRRAGIALKANVRSCDTPWARDDAAWFAANPERAHRVRLLFEGELQARRGTVVVASDKLSDLELPKEDDCVVLVRQVEPGLRVSMVLCGTFGEPIPDIEAIVHAAFDLLAQGDRARRCDYHGPAPSPGRAAEEKRCSMKTSIIVEMREQIAKLPAESRHELASLFAKVVERYEQYDLLHEQYDLLQKHAHSVANAAIEKLLETVPHDNIEDWLHSTAASRAEEGDLGDLMSLLNYGRWSERPQGIRLTNRECRILFDILQGKRKLPRRANEKTARAMKIAHYSFLLELNGMPTESAIKSTEALYGMKRSSIFAARKKYPLLGDEPDAETRRTLIAAFEADAARSQSKNFTSFLGPLSC